MFERNPMYLYKMIESLKRLAFTCGLLLLSILYSCNTKESKPTFVSEIEKAHNKSVWDEKNLLKANIQVTFGGNTVLDGVMYMEPWVGNTRFDLTNGTSIIYTRDTVWINKDSANISRPRFHALTWPYFLAAPYKLNDPGTILSLKENNPLKDGDSYQTAKLSFKSGTGDTPDDWYYLYKDKKTDMLKAMAYIVTYGKEKKKAEEDPHAIVYEDFKEIEGVPVSHKWVFYAWEGEEKGISKQLGVTTLNNISFPEPDEQLFKPDERFSPTWD